MGDSHHTRTILNDPEATLPDDAHVCATCGEAYPTATLLIHHRGIRHFDALSDDERERYYDAYDEEQAMLRRFRIIALGGLIALYFGFLFMYALFAL